MVIIRKNYWLTFCIFIFYALIRLFPLWRDGDRAFGYDSGIYRHYINGYWEKFGDPALQPLAFSWFSNFFKLLGFTTDFIMFPLYFLLGCLMFWLVYFVVKKYFNEKTAVWSVFLFSISVIQFEYYWWYYYRSFLAVIFLLLALLLFHYRSYWVILFLVFALCLHPLMALPVLLAVGAMIFADKNCRRYWLIVVGAAIAGSLVLVWREFFGQLQYLQNNAWRAGFDRFGATESTGQFVTPWFFVRSVIVYLFFALLGLWQYGKKQKLLALIFIFSLLGALAQIVFYRRLFVWLDLILIIFAGALLSDWLASLWKYKIIKIAVMVFCVFTVFSISRYAYLKQPLISADEFAAVQAAGLTNAEYILSSSSRYAPWLYGWTDKKIIAAGMFENNLWTYDEWLIFWQGEDSEKIKELMARYGGQVYVFNP